MDKFLEHWIEIDLNPIVIFSSTGKILSLNQEASFLLSKVDSKKIFDLAILNAPSSFGFETKFETITINRFEFYATTIGYLDEERLGIKLYKVIQSAKPIENTKNNELANIFTLIDLVIATNAIENGTCQFVKNLDPTIPETKLDINGFIKHLDVAYKAFNKPTKMVTTVRYIIGEYIVIEAKKYPLCEILVESSASLEYHKIGELKNWYANTPYIATVESNSISITLPLIPS